MVGKVTGQDAFKPIPIRLDDQTSKSDIPLDQILDAGDWAIDSLGQGVSKFKVLKKEVKVISFVTSPGNIKKIFKVFRESMKFAGYYAGKTFLPNVCTIMKTTGDLIDIYNLFKAGKFWVAYFKPNFSSSDQVNQKKFKANLEKALVDAGLGRVGDKEVAYLADEVCKQLFQEKTPAAKDGKREADFRKKIEKILNEKSIRTEKSAAVAKNIKIQSSSNVDGMTALAIACFTVADFGDVLFTLERWGLLDFSKCSQMVGKVFPVFLKVTSAGVEKALAQINCIGLAIILGKSTQELYRSVRAYQAAEDEAVKKQAMKRMMTHTITIVVTGIDLSCTVIPLAFALSPPALAACAIVAKSTALVGSGIKLALK